MAFPRGKDAVALAALLGAGVLGGWMTLRARVQPFTDWTDGERSFSTTLDARIRHAVWDAPEPLAGVEGEAGEPALAPDGRWLVFSAGARGLNAELYLVELVDGIARSCEPLTALNTPADELAPAFADGALLFASDRPGGVGSLDLWRAPYADGVFDPAAPLGPGVNSPADETDPAALRGSDGILFASNRHAARLDFDLYRAWPDEEGLFEVEPVDELNSPADERDPSPSADQRSLYFASTRAGGAGGFDLWRSVRTASSWQAPEPVPGINGPEAERGPWVTADGFTLYFDAAREDGERRLMRARSLELFLVPPPPITLAEWTLFAGLLALALLALLAKRWDALDIVYKSFLVSLVVHLVLMLYLRTVHPRGELLSLDGRAEASGEGPVFRVQRAEGRDADGELQARRGLEGPSGPERSSAGAGVDPEALPEVAALEAPQRDGENGPARQALPDVPSADDVPVALVDREGPAERSSAAAPGLALTARAGVARAADAAVVAPEVYEAGTTELDVARPGAAMLAGTAVDPGAGGQGPARAALARGSAPSAEVALAGPAESLARNAGTTPGLALAPAASRPSAGRATSGASRATLAPEEQGDAAPARGTQLPAAAGGASDTSSQSAPARSALALADAAGEGANDGGPSLRAPQAEAARAGAASPGFDATAGLAKSGGSPGTGAALAFARTGPERSGSVSQEGATLAAAPARGTELRAATPGASDASTQPGPARGELARARGQGESGLVGGGPSVRAPAAEVPPRASAPSPGFDATSGLGRASATSAGASALASASGPARSSSGKGESASGLASPGGSAPLAAPTGADALVAPARERSTTPSPAAGDEKVAAKNPALRAPSAPAAPERTKTSEPPRAFDATAGLAGPAARAREATNAAAPERASIEQDAPVAGVPPAPAPLRLPAPAVADTDALDRTPRPRLSETPYQNRFGEQKLRALEDFGGTVETERAVAGGLAYLARIQDQNGAWGQRSDGHTKYLDVRIGKSALALLAFLGAGHLPGGSTEHAGVAERAVRYLLAQQDPASGHFGRSCSYGHGIATYALAECYALNQDAGLRPALERALEEILRHQDGRDDPRLFGGWGYYFADGHVWNDDDWPRTSVTAWQVMALESARLGGLAVPDRAFDAAREFLLATWDQERRAFRYDHDPDRLNSGYPILPASTPAALFALSLLSVDVAARELAPARRFVLTRAPDGYRYTGDDDFVERARGNLYFWYYATLAMFRVGGAEWERWNEALKETLLPAQDEDGSWRPLDIYSEYAGDEDDERTYSTAMCVLSLEIYYRYFTPLLKVR